MTDAKREYFIDRCDDSLKFIKTTSLITYRIANDFIKKKREKNK